MTRKDRRPCPCARCGTLLPDGCTRGRPNGERMCRRCSNQTRPGPTPKACSVAGCDAKHYGCGFCVSHYRDADREAKRVRDRAKTSQRRAKTKGAYAEVIRMVEIGERDGWRCFCGRRVDRTKAYPHRRCPTLDHILPLSLGGEHVFENVRIAHWDCNVRRGAAVEDVQLLLVG